MKGKGNEGTTLEKAIEKMGIGGHNQFADCFANFLDLALSYFCNNMDERQMMLRKKVDDDNRFCKAYAEALYAYGDAAEGYHDPIGDIFMERVSHGEKGQFFTPEDMSLLMARITMPDDVHDGMTINDPCCGSGRTLMMALKYLREEKKVEPVLYANDLSMTCAKMTLLNFCMYSVDGMVTCSDALLNDPDGTTFFKIDKLRNLVTNKVLTTYWQYTAADVEKVREKREKWRLWVAERAWVKYFKATPKTEEEVLELKEIEPMLTEIKVDNSGQISMF